VFTCAGVVAPLGQPNCREVVCSNDEKIASACGILLIFAERCEPSS
jgi:hypothetical protein